jgi:hypothetical protein
MQELTRKIRVNEKVTLVGLHASETDKQLLQAKSPSRQRAKTQANNQGCFDRITKFTEWRQGGGLSHITTKPQRKIRISKSFLGHLSILAEEDLSVPGLQRPL